MFNRRTFIIGAAATPFAAVFAGPVRAAEPEVFSENEIAIRGADPVAFFTQGTPVLGSADHALMWRGTMWHFASAQTMEMFTANPEAYAPQYGGYCAYAASQGYVASTVPEAWTVYNGKLYLNNSTGVRRRWLRDIDSYIVAADANWPGILA